MFKGDLLLSITPQQQCSADIIELYNIFEKLKIVLRFRDGRFFTGNSASVCITLSQALQLFQQFGNHKAASACFWHLAHIHSLNGRLKEAVDCFQAAYQHAVEVQQRHVCNVLTSIPRLLHHSVCSNGSCEQIAAILVQVKKADCCSQIDPTVLDSL